MHALHAKAHARMLMRDDDDAFYLYAQGWPFSRWLLTRL
jgi:hypothetical protein